MKFTAECCKLVAGFATIVDVHLVDMYLVVVLQVCVSVQLDYYAVSERWVLGDVKAVFSRRYLHQNKALEIFFANRCKHTCMAVHQHPMKAS